LLRLLQSFLARRYTINIDGNYRHGSEDGTLIWPFQLTLLSQSGHKGNSVALSEVGRDGGGRRHGYLVVGWCGGVTTKVYNINIFHNSPAAN